MADAFIEANQGQDQVAEEDFVVEVDVENATSIEEIVDVVEGTGKNQGRMGALILRTVDNKLMVNVGIGFSDTAACQIRALPEKTFCNRRSRARRHLDQTAHPHERTLLRRMPRAHGIRTLP